MTPWLASSPVAGDLRDVDWDEDTEAMGSPMGPHDMRRGMALSVSASAEAMVCGGTRFVGAPLRPGRDRAPAGDVECDSWSDDEERAVRQPSRAVGSGTETTTPLPAGRENAAVAVTLAPNVGHDSACLSSSMLESTCPVREGAGVGDQPLRLTSVMSRARGMSAAQSASRRGQVSRGSREEDTPEGFDSERSLMAQVLQSQRDFGNAVSEVRREMLQMNHRVNYIEGQWADSSVISRSEASRVSSPEPIQPPSRIRSVVIRDPPTRSADSIDHRQGV